MKYVFTFILIAFSYVSHAQYTNLVLEGGGMKGIAYAGALEVLDSLGISDSIERIAGTSSGAMNGLMYALGYSGKEIRHLNLNTNFGKYNQVGFPLIGGLIRVKKTYGYYKTDKLIEDLGKVMAAKGFSPDLTFEELYIAHQSGKNVKLLYLTGANLTDQKTEVFSHETYPTMQVLDAIRISISIPMYFEAVFMQPDGSLVEKNDADSTTKIMVDGGVLDNYPFFVFDTLVTVNSGDNSYYKCNIHSLGIKLETDSSMLDIATRTIGKTGDFMGAFSELSSEHLNRRHLGPQQKLQTIFINTHNFNPKLKRQKKATKLRVMQYGRKAVFEYFISR
ncbi:patatin-like phospholipase family protein [Bacteroidia bacterium]|jgi:NTE family protein|nr:patatin-like phospholipase family protein [Bacteroidia bacterium]